MKKVMYLTVFVAVILIGYSFYYFDQYSIEDENSAIQTGLKEWTNKNSDSMELDIIEVVPLDDTSSHIVLFQTSNSNIGYAHLIKGWNGKFKIDRSGSGSNVVSYEVIKTNKGMYGILVGKNPDLTIDHIKADLYDENFTFTANVSTDGRFVKYEQLPNSIEKTFPAELTFYDKNGSEVKLQELLD